MSQRPAQPLSRDDVRDWYEAMKDSLLAYRANTIAALGTTGLAPGGRFVGLTIDEVDERFTVLRNELENVTVFSLMASAEAALLIDYETRLAAKGKDPLSKAYRKLQVSLRISGWFVRKSRPRVDNHILEAIKDSGIVPGHTVGNFRDALNLRHWLAHGRYWAVNLGRTLYSPEDIYAVTNAVVGALPS